MTVARQVCQCRHCIRVDYLHFQETEYGRRERISAQAGDFKNAHHYSALRVNALKSAERQLLRCEGNQS